MYAPSGLDDIKLARHVDSHIKRIEELGFLHKLRGTTDQFEVRRILRAFVDGQWLSQFDQRLEAYLADGSGAIDPGDVDGA